VEACPGCRSDALYAGCRTCGLRDCAVGRGVAHCVECADYPCGTYERWRSVSKLLPHVREATSNLEAIARDGVEDWLAAQKTRWSCPACGTRFSWYAASCAECGRSLRKEAHAMKGLRKLVCRLVLPMVYRKGKASQR
jgi:hypothetical protein